MNKTIQRNLKIEVGIPTNANIWNTHCRLQTISKFKNGDKVTVNGFHFATVTLILGRGSKRGKAIAQMNYLIELDLNCPIAEWNANQKDREAYGMKPNKRYEIALENWLCLI